MSNGEHYFMPIVRAIISKWNKSSCDYSFIVYPRI